MKKRILRSLSYVLVAALSAGIAFWLAVPIDTYGKLDELEDLIAQRFIGEPDWDAMEDAAAMAMVDATGDRWSYYIPASEYAAYLEQNQNAYVGVGITIEADEESGGFRIMQVSSGSGAQEAGLQAGDLLIFVGDQDVRGLPIQELRDLVRGPEGTSVSLTVMRAGETAPFEVERRTVLTEVATGELLEGDVGYVRILNFDGRSAEETVAVIEALRLQGAKKLLFDVRNNPGGHADELVNLLDYLLPEGDLFRTVDDQGREQVDRSDANCLELPMAVLVNASSYSAAEFFAAALREYDAAVVVGERTVGKGYFQRTFELMDGSAVALSVGKYFTPKGVSLAEEGGLVPDVLCPIDPETEAGIYYGSVELNKDPQVKAALEALE